MSHESGEQNEQKETMEVEARDAGTQRRNESDDFYIRYYVGHQGKFGQFNSTDIWFFTGKLIATTLRNLGIAHNAVNKFDLFYLFDEKDKDPLSLLGFAGSIPVIAKTKEDGKRYYRLK